MMLKQRVFLVKWWIFVTALIPNSIQGNNTVQECLDESEKSKQLARQYQLCTLSTEKDLAGSNSVDWITRSPKRMCTLLERVLNNCTIIYEQCFDDDTMRTFQDSQIEAYIQAALYIYQVPGFSQVCPVVKEFLERKNLSDESEGLLCPRQRAEEWNKSFNQCTRKVNLELKQRLSNSRLQSKRRQRIFCNGIFKAVYGCSLLLTECFSQDNIVKKISVQKMILRKVLGVSVKAENTNIDLCTVYGGHIGPAIHVDEATTHLPVEVSQKLQDLMADKTVMYSKSSSAASFGVFVISLWSLNLPVWMDVI